MHPRTASSVVRRLVAGLALFLGFLCPSRALTEMNWEGVPDTTRVAVEELTDAINSRDAARMTAIFDLDALEARVFDGLSIDAAFRREFSQGFRQSFINGLVQSVPQGTNMRLLRLRPEEGFIKALYRFDLGNGGFSFTEFWISEDVGATPRVIDLYSYVNARLSSGIMKQMLMLTLPQNEGFKSLLGRALGLDRMADQDTKKITAIFTEIAQQNFAAAAAAFRDLPENLRANRDLIAVGQFVAQRANDRLLANALLRDLAHFHGDDPALAFALMDYYFLQGDFAKADASLVAFQEMIQIEEGSIPWLRGATALRSDDSERALTLFELAVKQEPEFAKAYFNIMDIAAAKGDHDRILSAITTMERDLGYEFDPALLAEMPEYAAFLESSLGKSWLAGKAASGGTDGN